MSEAGKPSEQQETLTFWDHLDELRTVIIRILVITAIAAVAAFCLKEELFAVVLAPRSSDFITYRLMGVEPFSISLMNTGLTEQFMVHLRTALYDHERRYATLLVGSGYMMFMVGTLLNYLLIFPLTVKFLGTYQVSPEVTNMLTLQSYMDTLLMMNFVMGIVFELPVVSWILGKMGVISAQMMSSMRRHAVVAILIVAAMITPTTDAFTLFVVALPIWLLYEMSIWIVRITQ